MKGTGRGEEVEEGVDEWPKLGLSHDFLLPNRPRSSHSEIFVTVQTVTAGTPLLPSGLCQWYPLATEA